jgi:hypothetical protein
MGYKDINKNIKKWGKLFSFFLQNSSLEKYHKWLRESGSGNIEGTHNQPCQQIEPIKELLFQQGYGDQKTKEEKVGLL